MKKIFIDAGHGGKDSGAVNRGRYEKNDNLRLALLVKERLQKKDFAVMLSRETDKTLALRERTAMANSWGADLFISLHRNAFVTSAPYGAEIWVQNDCTSENASFAELLMKKLKEAGISKDRGVKKGDYHVNRESRMTSCLLELLFISNNGDNELFDELIEAYAEAISAAVSEFFKSEKSEEKALYRVQVGAFRSRQNAEMVMEKLKEAGFPAIVVE